MDDDPPFLRIIIGYRMRQNYHAIDYLRIE